jgi:K+-sensing histidine kinase KdpD
VKLVLVRSSYSRTAEAAALVLAFAVIALLTAIYVALLGVTNSTTVALSFLLVVLIVATMSTRWVAIATSLMAFLSFNFFFLPPVGTWTVADPQNWVALFTLLAVSIVASHLSAEVRRRARQEAAVLEERKEAEVMRRGAEIKSMLLASLSHDLKTPLTAMTVAANNLDTEWLTEEQRREQVDIVRTELGRLNRLFEDIVDMARIEANAVASEPEWVHPSEIIEAAARQVGRALDTHTLEIDADAERTLTRLDPRLTSAAVAHLLENAAQYSPPRSTIAVRATLSAGDLQFTVRDHGVGIAAQDLEHLFERFYRGVDARQQRFGTGMGLAITRGLLAAEGGRVWAENHPEGGAVFTIAVPVESRAAALEGDPL